MAVEKKLFCQMIVCLCFAANALVNPVSAQNSSAGFERTTRLHTVDPETAEGLQKLFEHTGKSLLMVSAHRGGVRKGFPENCIATFENTLKHTAAIMEIDPRYTKDGAIVLHHDNTLERTTNGKGPVSDYTLGELKQLRLKDSDGNLTEYSMPTLDEALEWARGKTILVLDDKGVSIQERVRKIEEHNAEAYAMIMAYNYEDARLCYKLNNRIMMEIFIKNHKQLEAFDKTGIPWRNVVVFVGHSSPEDSDIYSMINAKGASCMASTSRDIEGKFIKGEITRLESLDKAYRALLEQGVDIIETDIPIEAGQLLFDQNNADKMQAEGGYGLVWSDEFDLDGRPDPDNWVYEHGFVRNDELQWYRPENAVCENGVLVIEGRRERLANPDYDSKSSSWRRNREYAEYTSSCLKTSGKHRWTFGRFVMRGRIDVRGGLWPAFWTLGSARGWPGCGEIDIMEYYRGNLLANACWGSGVRWKAVWDDVRKPVKSFEDPDWAAKFHVWRMDWDKDFIRLYVDDELLNTIELTKTINNDREKANPFHEPHYILLNLAIGGTNGGDASGTKFPSRFEVDYVRVFQKQAGKEK